MTQTLRPLRRRLMLVFIGFGMFTATLFGFFAIAFGYAAEDAFFTTQLADEAAYQRRAYARDGRWAAPRNAGMRLYPGVERMPEEIRAILGAEPARREVAGEGGRHYHLHRIPPEGRRPEVWLVHEVGQLLVIRPMRGQWLSLLAWMGLGIVLLAVVLGTWLAWRITAPLSALSDAVQRIRPEAFPERLPSTEERDEVGLLARCLRDLMRRTEAFIAREREFTRDASHELRTPLAVIRSAGERLARISGLDADARLQLDHIRHSAAQLEQTVAALLAMAREDEQPAAQPLPLPLLATVERVIVEQSPLLAAQDLQVAVDIAAGHRVHAAPGVLHILLSNLIGNAFAHAVCGTVHIDLDGDRLRIANRGHAIPRQLLSDLHVPWKKREASAGFGLGLSIVQRLCERHHIGLEILHEDDGLTQVWVRFAEVSAAGA